MTKLDGKSAPDECGPEYSQAWHEIRRKKELEKERDQLQSQPPGEYRDKRLRALKEEIKAIDDWQKRKKETPTAGDPLIIKDFPPAKRTYIRLSKTKDEYGSPPEKFIDDLIKANKEIEGLRSNMGRKLSEQRVEEAIKRFVAGHYEFVEKEMITTDWWDETNGLKYARQEVFLKVAQNHRIKANKTSLYRVYMALVKGKPLPLIKWLKF